MPSSTASRRAIAAALVVAAVGAAVVLAVRLDTWSWCWRGSITEGREGPGLYAIWRLLHGFPLYEATIREPYSLTLYNFGFYHAYAGLMRVLRVDGEGLLFAPRFVSLLGAAFGAAVFLRVAARLSPPSSKSAWAALGALGFIVWFGTQFVAWWAFAVRPDVWAAALAFAGLSCVLTALAKERVVCFGLASLLFACAWSFKQSTVWTFAGSLLAITLLRRRVTWTLALLMPFVLIVATALVLGGPLYRENVLWAPVRGRWEWELFTGVLARALPQNPWIFGFPLLVLAWECRAGVRAGWQRLAEHERLIMLVMLVACAFGSFAFGREGSNKNHLLEGYAVSALAAWCALGRLPATAPRWLGVLGAASTLPLVLLPLLQLASTLGFGADNRFGRTLFCRKQDGAAYASLAAAVARMPHPVYADDEVLAQPWHSTNDRYPALALDGTWFGIARREGLLSADFPVPVLEQRHYGTALLPGEHPMIDVLRAHGATCETLPQHPLGFTYIACRLRQQ